MPFPAQHPQLLLSPQPGVGRVHRHILLWACGVRCPHRASGGPQSWYLGGTPLGPGLALVLYLHCLFLWGWRDRVTLCLA